MDERYSRQSELLTPEGQRRLAGKRVAVIGCGGLGGYLIEYMVRLGVGIVTAVDGDVFEPSNLNRQLLSAEDILGRSKASAAAERARRVNPHIKVFAVEAYFNEENADALTAGQDLMLDALDNIPARLLMEDVCARHNVPIVHGAIEGWTAQNATVLPGSHLLHRLYSLSASQPRSHAALPFTPAFCAAIQAAEALRLLLGQPGELAGKLLLSNLQTMEQRTISLE